MRNNCPNCGAPIEGARCAYCGTVFYDFSNIEIGKTSYLRMRLGDAVSVFEAVPEQIDITATGNKERLWADGKVFEIQTTPEYNVTISFLVRPNKEGIIYTTIKKEEE